MTPREFDPPAFDVLPPFPAKGRQLSFDRRKQMDKEEWRKSD
jgi:hypothetical protein